MARRKRARITPGIYLILLRYRLFSQESGAGEMKVMAPAQPAGSSGEVSSVYVNFESYPLKGENP